MKKVNNIHFVGIKGVGMTPLAIIAKEAGVKVTGSDLTDIFITDEELKKSNIKVLEGFSSENVGEPDLVIYTGAHGGEDNEEVQEAKKKNIRCLNQGQALGLFQSGEFLGVNLVGVSIAGSHGKTTTTSMIANILIENKKDPSYVIGAGETPSLGLSGHFGKGEIFINEADEYFADVEHDKRPKFYYQKPKYILITNLDYDHPDVYDSYEDVEREYLNFVEKLPTDGVLIMCGDGEKNRNFLAKIKGNIVTYGLSPDNDFVLEKVNMNPEKMFFWVRANETSLGEFSINTFGIHNAKNALGSIVLSMELGLSIEQAKHGIASYSGTKRRLEMIGELPFGGKLYDDYAHHPEEIKESISAIKKTFPEYKIIVIFQPHMYSRTKKLLKDFSFAFDDADEILMMEVFSSFREGKEGNFSSKNLSDLLNERGKVSKYFNDPEDVIKYVPSQNYPKKTILVTMGAGDIYKIGKDLLNNG